MKQIISILLLMLSSTFVGISQNVEVQQYIPVFQAAYQACPDIPKGLLEAISFTNTHCNHLTDANYFTDGPDAMPRAYGLMGLVKDGKGYFRENLHLVAELSGISEAEILQRPEMNVLAYAKALDHLAKASKAAEMDDYLAVVQQLSELPIGEEKDAYPMQCMLQSVCMFLNDAKRAEQFGFPKQDMDPPDYPQAIWVPAPECNWEPRTKEVSAVVIHYTEGSYAGCISWFLNCDSEVSAHYIIRSVDGQVTQMVREADKAWHARSANGYTIGIEHEAYGNIWSFFTEAMYQSSADLVRSICSRYETIDGKRTHDRDTLDNGFCLNNGLYNLGGEGACVKIRGHQHYPDQSHTDPGPYWDWNYYYKLINEGTPVTVLEGDHGRLDHQDYADDERRIWVIRGPEGSKINITFSSFHLEQDFDFLRIYDGDNVFAPQLGRWNTQSPQTVRASGNTMCVEFRSDCLTTDTGWEAAWTAVSSAALSDKPGEWMGVSPNPFSDHLTVTADSDAVSEVTVYDLYGNLMVPTLRFQRSVSIEARHWPSGVYVVRCHTLSGKGGVSKVVKL